MSQGRKTRRLGKRFMTVLLTLAMIVSLTPSLGALTGGALGAQEAYAETDTITRVDVSTVDSVQETIYVNGSVVHPEFSIDSVTSSSGTVTSDDLEIILDEYSGWCYSYKLGEGTDWMHYGEDGIQNLFFTSGESRLMVDIWVDKDGVVFTEDTEVYLNGKRMSFYKTYDSDTDYVGYLSYTAEDIGYMPGTIAITYDATRVFPTTRMTGREVSTQFRRYITCNTDDTIGPDDRWYVYDARETPSLDNASKYTCLVKKDGDEYIRLHESDEPLTASAEYYWCFNIEENDDYDYILNTESLPYVTVNGTSVDVDVRWGARTPAGDLYVYAPAPLNETGDILPLGISITPKGTAVQKGTSRTFTATAYATTNDAVVWSVSGNQSTGTTIDPSTGTLIVASDETASSVRIAAASVLDNSVKDEIDVNIVEDEVGIDSVTIRGNKEHYYSGDNVGLWAEVTGHDYHDVTWELFGAASENTKFLSVSGSEARLEIGKDETSNSIVVRATSKADPTKFDDYEVDLQPHPYVESPIKIRYEASWFKLTEDTTGREITREFRKSITSPFRETDIDGAQWYVYGNMSDESKYTALVRKDNPESWDVVKLNEDDTKLDPDGEYYLWFNIEESYPYVWKDKGEPSALPTVYVNGKPADRVVWGNDLEVYVKVDVVKDLGGAKIADIPDQTYTGTYVDPAPKVTLDGKTLVRGTDYTVSYKNNVNVGTAKAIIEGKGAYTGKITKDFKIKPRSITKTTRTLSAAKYTYDGNTHKPTVTVKDKVDGTTKKLVAGTDYTVTIKNSSGTTVSSPKKVGRYKVYIKG
ncbi:MAG: hypothetical protein II482_04645, partial [Lachnospiraceae bacterium]|nr:hypothetical protein [Lachnospiraceae bacterium]